MKHNLLFCFLKSGCRVSEAGLGARITGVLCHALFTLGWGVSPGLLCGCRTSTVTTELNPHATSSTSYATILCKTILYYILQNLFQECEFLFLSFFIRQVFCQAWWLISVITALRGLRHKLLSLKPDWATHWVPGQPAVSGTLFQHVKLIKT